MARWFRLYEKKRGSRRTGSPLWGVVGEALFFLSLFFLGTTSLVAVIASLSTRTWPASEYFPEVFLSPTTCEVIDKRLGESPSQLGPTEYRPEILVRFERDGTTYRVWTYNLAGQFDTDLEEQRAVLDLFEVGQLYPAWLDEKDPNVIVLRKGWNWDYT